MTDIAAKMVAVLMVELADAIAIEPTASMWA
jgi:hypothetical protein